MGTRTLYRICDGDRNLVATLISNCSHPTQTAEAEVKAAMRDQCSQNGPTALLQLILEKRYSTSEGNHQEGDRIFWIAPADEFELGDQQWIITVTHTGFSPSWFFKRVGKS
jgi:hypothetical protein